MKPQAEGALAVNKQPPSHEASSDGVSIPRYTAYLLLGKKVFTTGIYYTHSSDIDVLIGLANHTAYNA